MAGYRDAEEEPDHLLAIFELKELLKTWRMAYHALDGKHWPSGCKRFVRRFYIDRFFLRELETGVSPWL